MKAEGLNSGGMARLLTKDADLRWDSPETGEPERFMQCHYSVAQVAKLWNISPDLVRKIFEKEPGVLAIGRDRSTRGSRRYLTLRIPESVLSRVHRRLSRV